MARLMVLGILRTKAMSGYDLQQVLRVSAVDKWAGILPGSIYHALKKMDNEGLVRIADVTSTGHRTKAIYEITEAGEKEYKKLLLESFREPSVHLPVQLYTGLSMVSQIEQADIEHVKEALEEQVQILNEKILEIEEGQRIKSDFVGTNSLMKLTFENMIEQNRLQVSFLEKIIENING